MYKEPKAAMQTKQSFCLQIAGAVPIICRQYDIQSTFNLCLKSRFTVATICD